MSAHYRGLQTCFWLMRCERARMTGQQQTAFPLVYHPQKASSSLPPVFLPSLSPPPSPLHSCCAVSSDLVCQSLSSSSASLLFTPPSWQKSQGRPTVTSFKMEAKAPAQSAQTGRPQCFAWHTSSGFAFRVCSAQVESQGRADERRRHMGLVTSVAPWRLYIWLPLTHRGFMSSLSCLYFYIV